MVPSDTLILQKDDQLLSTSHTGFITSDLVLKSGFLIIELLGVSFQSGNLVFNFLHLSKFGIKGPLGLLCLLRDNSELLLLWHNLLVDKLIGGKGEHPSAQVTSWKGLDGNNLWVEVRLSDVVVSDLPQFGLWYSCYIEGSEFLKELL